MADEATAALDPTGKDVPIGGAGLAASAIELGLVDELRIFRNPLVVGGGTPFRPPVTEDVRLDLVGTRMFGSRARASCHRRGIIAARILTVTSLRVRMSSDGSSH